MKNNCENGRSYSTVSWPSPGPHVTLLVLVSFSSGPRVILSWSPCHPLLVPTSVILSWSPCRPLLVPTSSSSGPHVVLSWSPRPSSSPGPRVVLPWSSRHPLLVPTSSSPGPTSSSPCPQALVRQFDYAVSCSWNGMISPRVPPRASSGDRFLFSFLFCKMFHFKDELR